MLILFRKFLTCKSCCLALVLGLLLRLLPADALQTGEYSVKAAFVYNFLKYVEWPLSTSSPATGPVRLGILGVNEFEDSFEKFKGKSVGERNLEIVEIKGNQDLNGYQAILICRSEKDRLKDILSKLNSAPVLTIGDSPGFMEEGIMINLIPSNDKLSFEINLKTAKAAGIRMSSQLLKLASAIQE